jgi:ATP-dependent 26S proteasome regulatory subunit
VGAIFLSYVLLNLTTIFFQWVGDAEKYVGAIFSLASKLSPAVIFVDEVCKQMGRSCFYSVGAVFHSQLLLFFNRLTDC